MADFAVKTKSIDTTDNYNLYCHYVAGLVGYGLSDLFSASGLEDAGLKEQKELSNSMGLFLQKTNIIRDYLEDLVEGRTWWPEDIWSKHGKSLDAFRKSPDAASSLNCLNELVDDALALAPASLKYLSLLKNKEIFHFCAIPQVMAMATLSEVYNNVKVFKGVVKVRKGLSCKMMLGVNDMAAVGRYFNLFSQKIEAKMPSSSCGTAKLMKEVQQLTKPHATLMSEKSLRLCHQLAWLVLLICFASSYCCSSKNAVSFSKCDVVSCTAMMLSIGYLAGLFGTQYF
jgi:farnesyl-diphosphate farnesyltransferase